MAMSGNDSSFCWWPSLFGGEKRPRHDPMNLKRMGQHHPVRQAHPTRTPAQIIQLCAPLCLGASRHHWRDTPSCYIIHLVCLASSASGTSSAATGRQQYDAPVVLCCVVCTHSIPRCTRCSRDLPMKIRDTRHGGPHQWVMSGVFG